MDINIGGFLSGSDTGGLFASSGAGSAKLDAKSVGDIFAQKVKENMDAVTGMGSKTDSSDKQEPKEAITFFRKNSDKTQSYIKKDDTVHTQKTETKGGDKGKITKGPLGGNLSDAVNEKYAAATEMIADTLGVTAEEVIAAMQALGLTFADLFLPENLSQLVVNIAGGGEMVSLVTNDELYGNLQEITKQIELIGLDLSETFSLEDGELTALLQQFASGDANTLETDAQGKTTAQSSAKEADAAVSAPVKTDQERVATPVIEVEVTAKPVLKEDEKASQNLEAQTQTQETLVKSPSLQNAGEDKGASAHSRHKGGANTEQSTPIPFGAPNVGNANFNAIQTADALLSSFGTKTEQIMRQVMDYMRLHVGTETTDLEMQLHPAGLGNVRLQMAVTDGAVNAKFIAQNEAVKAALEASLVTLRENLDKQGVKVSAIEVEVSASAYDQNAHEDGANAQNEYERQASETASRRRALNLGDLGNIEEADLSDSDIMEARVMEQTGGRVSYRA